MTSTMGYEVKTSTLLAGNIGEPLTFDETSPVGPALASLNGVLYLAWTGTDNSQLNIMTVTVTVTSGGASLASSSPVTLSQISPASPALCAAEGGLFIAWTGSGNSQLNVAQVQVDQAGVATGIGEPTVIENETSPAGPALASLNGELYLAWTGTGNSQLNVAQVQVDQAGVVTGFQGTNFPSQTSPVGPALASLDGVLYLAWTGSDNNHHLNVATVQVDQAGVATGLGYQPFGSSSAFGQRSPAGPALASQNGQLDLAWTGTGNNQLNTAVTAFPAGGPAVVTSSQTSPASPALCGFEGDMFIAWAGTDNNQLNLAFVGQ